MDVLHYHRTVTSALHTVARLARSSPWVAVIEVPVMKAVQVAQRQVSRHPTIMATHTTRTALRRAGVAAVQLVVMPPTGDTVTMLLMSNVVPPGSREVWQHALIPEPLTWRNYALTRLPDNRVTWRLSEAARDHYRQRVARLITGRGGPVDQGKRPYQLPPETAAQQILQLAAHLRHYPGFAGVRSDIFDLAQHSTKIWKATHSQRQWPVWPTMPYVRFSQPQTRPIEELTHFLEEQKNAKTNDNQHDQHDS